MDISEIGVSRQIRILESDCERLIKLKIAEEEPWYKVVNRTLNELETLKKRVKQLEQERVKQG